MVLPQNNLLSSVITMVLTSDDTNGDGIEDDSKPSSKFKEIIDFENFQADLVDIDELYNDGKLSKMEYLKHKARLALNLTTAE